MMSFVLTLVTTCLFALAPGLLWLLRREQMHGAVAAALVGFSSVVAQSLVALVFALLGWPVQLVLPLIAALTIGGLVVGWSTQWWRSSLWTWLVIAGALVLTLSMPFLAIHNGLPTGDSQKAIFWAQDILSGQPFPNYDTALPHLNRDKVDFFTPALHALTASVMSWALSPLMSVGILSIVAGVAVALLAAALLRTVWVSAPRWWPELLTIFLVLTNFRFLRYLREPGYHFQNVIGELLLFGVLFVSLRLIERWRWSEAVLLVLGAGTLALSHQYSAFLAGFLLLPVIAALLWQRRQALHSARELFIPALGAVVIGVVAWRLGILHKAARFFTADAHLLPLVPDWFDYVTLMGATWLLLGLAGLGWALWQMRRRHPHQVLHSAFIASTIVLLLLSQGPRLGVDIPPVRALLYSVVPLSVLGAYFLVSVWHTALTVLPRQRWAVVSLLGLLLVGASTASVATAYRLSHTVRTNSTLTIGQLQLSETLAAWPEDGAVLTDDYNRRSSSWLVLSSRAMFTRLASALTRPMQEARQSDVRMQTYLANLDFDKIYALGSWPGSRVLWEKHDIAAVTGVTRSSDTTFAANPALRALATADGLTVYVSENSAVPACTWGLTDQQEQWLLHPTTLANDIGDAEDTFEHLPASVRATRLSDFETVGSCTQRVTRAPFIPLVFNIGDYVHTLWDQDGDGMSDRGVQLVVVLTTPVAELSVALPDDEERHFTTRTGVFTLPPTTLPDDGLLSIQLMNPQEAAVGIDLIAVGLTNVP